MFDVAVVGAGPAGLAAAVHACNAGLQVVLIDAGRQPGGQFWRHRDEAAAAETHSGEGRSAEGSGHHDWKNFAGLRTLLYDHEAAGRLRYFRGTQVWLAEPAGVAESWRLWLTPTSDAVAVTSDVPDRIEASHVILCPGGYDRQLPVQGWDLPGVMAAGGVQALLKGSQVVPGLIGVVAGTGPFLLPVATALAAAGTRVAAICEANSPTGWLRNVAGAVRAPEKMVEGAGYAALLARHRIPYRTRTAVTEIHGTERVEAVTLSRLNQDGSPVPGSGWRVVCDFVALGWGFTPSLELVLAVGAETDVDVDGSLVAVVDQQLRRSVLGISVAGEATGIGGAAMAVVEGELAALSVVGAAAAPTATLPPRIARLQKERARLRAFAVAMHQATPVPRNWHDWLTPETIVCRCEEVSYGQLCRAHEDLGAQDARSLKSFARPGMGWCQGRVCGFATAQIAANLSGRTDNATTETAGTATTETNGTTDATTETARTATSRTASAADDLRAMSKRTLAAPVGLGQLAALTFPEPEYDGTTAPTERESSHD